MKHFAAMGLMLVAPFTALSADIGKAGASSSVAALHATIITPASNALFQAESIPPSTAQEWEKVRLSASELAQAASRLASQDVARGQDQWAKFAQALKRQAEQAGLAAQKRDQDGLVAANGDIVSVCEDCHVKYRDAGRSMK
jgi:hypothetical protein